MGQDRQVRGNGARALDGHEHPCYYPHMAATKPALEGGKTYLLGLEGQHISESRFDPLDRQPESVAPSEPFTDPSKFTTRGEGIRRDSKHGAPVIRLANFTYLDSVTVELDSPFASTWTGEVQECVG